ncbi:MAG: 2-oxo acid dehydrogenase subunit E2 [Candidatus Tectomicrobia bacterium]|nr:2-oxo acid dehydrogenase subunit E2 [Candidatus Tectomicrobia bacterium]
MSEAIRLPPPGGPTEKGSVVQWLKQPGEPVRRGEPLAILLFDKAEMELSSPADGVLAEVCVQPGQECEVGGVLGRIEREPAAAGGTGAKEVAPEAAQRGRLRASPRARRRAEELGVDLRSVRGTGPDGVVTEEDVLRAAGTPSPPAVAGEGAPPAVPLAGLRRATAERLSGIWREAPHVTLIRPADVTALEALRKEREEQWEASRGARPGIGDFVLRAAALTLRCHPALNSWLVEDGLRTFGDVHLGFAVAAREGLLVPVVRSAGEMDLFALAREVKRLTEAARAGRLSLEEMRGGTFTVTNLGTHGVEQFNPVLNPPQVAILGVGALREELALCPDGAVARRKVLRLCLTFDHRAVDGAPAAEALKTCSDLLEAPETLLEGPGPGAAVP